MEERDKLDRLSELHLEQFRKEGIDEDIKNMPRTWKNLIADHRYLHIGYYRLKQGKKFGNWTKDDIIKYHALIVSTLRKYYFPMLPIRYDS